MAIFGLEVDNTVRLNRIVKELDEKLKKPDLFQNPFTGSVELFKEDKPYMFVHFNVVWFNPIYFTLILAGGLLFASGFKITWWFIILIPMALGSFLHTKTFLRLALRYYIIKRGYKGLIKNMGEDELLLRLSHGAKRNN